MFIVSFRYHHRIAQILNGNANKNVHEKIREVCALIYVSI